MMATKNCKGRCPYCDSENIETVFSTIDFETAAVECSCLDCDRDFAEIYEVDVDYEETEYDEKIEGENTEELFR